MFCSVKHWDIGIHSNHLFIVQVENIIKQLQDDYCPSLILYQAFDTRKSYPLSCMNLMNPKRKSLFQQFGTILQPSILQYIYYSSPGDRVGILWDGTPLRADLDRMN